MGVLSLNRSNYCHWCSLYCCAWADSQRPATSLYLVREPFPESSPAQAQTAFQHHRVCLRCGSGQWLPPPPFPVTSGETERDASAGRASKEKEKRSGRATLVESLQSLTCEDSWKGQPCWGNVILYLSVSQASSNHLPTSVLWPVFDYGSVLWGSLPKAWTDLDLVQALRKYKTLCCNGRDKIDILKWKVIPFYSYSGLLINFEAFLPSMSHHLERRRIRVVSHIIFRCSCYYFGGLVTLYQWLRADWLQDTQTHRGGMCLVLWRVSYSRLRGVTLFNYIQLMAPVCLQGHPWPSPGLIWLPLQRKYEYELLFA